MALSELQRSVCRLLAAERVASGESYLAGGVALTEWLETARLSRDVDLFHDTESALEASWSRDRAALEGAGFRVQVQRERASFVDAEVSRDGHSIQVEWARDSSFRFFPLVEHPELGLTLHPLDLATNKLLALVGRREARDWFDLLACDAQLQPLGYLAWAASGKDPGWGPGSLVEQAARVHYAEAELAAVDFAGPRPDVAALCRSWHGAIRAARLVVEQLPPDEVGRCMLTAEGELCRLPPEDLPAALAAGELRFHPGRIRGAWPDVRS